MSDLQKPAKRERGDRSSEWLGIVRRSLDRYVLAVQKRDTEVTGLVALRELREIDEMVQGRTAEAVAALRSEEGGAYSWGEIGEALGISRQAAMKRYGGAELDSPRKRGAQPGHLR